MKKRKVLILSASEGHASLARAVREELKNYQFKEFEFDIHVGGAYKFFYRFAPSMFEAVWKMGQKKEAAKLIGVYGKMFLEKKMRKIMGSFRPDLIITTHFMYLSVLDRWRRRGDEFKQINVVFDPITISPLIYSMTADYNVGFGEEFSELGLKLGIEEKKLVEVGWLVGRGFYRPLSKQKKDELTKELGFEKNRLTLVVCGGSEGTNAILKIMPDLLAERYGDGLQVLVIAGSNRLLEDGLKRMINGLRKVGKKMPLLKIMGFTKRMADWLRLADVVVGKAGPNLIFEAVAAGKPFAAITHIEGQETGNLELIERYGLGWVVEKRGEFGSLLNRLMKNPNEKDKFKETIRKMAKRNYEGSKEFKKLVEGLIS